MKGPFGQGYRIWVQPSITVGWHHLHALRLEGLHIPRQLKPMLLAVMRECIAKQVGPRD
jgi:hypothetical protein